MHLSLIRQNVNEILDNAKQDHKSTEIIRPILRGQDIKRYSYEFAEQYLICTFPAKHDTND